MENLSLLDAFKVGSILLTLIVSISSLVVLFSRRYAAKDKAFTETIQNISMNFSKNINDTMTSIINFVDRKDVQMNATNSEYIKAIRGLQEQIEKSSIIAKELAHQIHQQNIMLQGQNDKLMITEVAIVELKAQLNELTYWIKNELKELLKNSKQS